MSESTVLCRHCGSPNPSGSKFCNKCGTPLPPSTSLLCPGCGTANPHHLLYCDNCGTRLVQDSPTHDKKQDDKPDAGPPRAFSLPARPPGQTGELDSSFIPDWLRTGQQEEAERQAAADLDEWLTQLADNEPVEDIGEGEGRDADLPAWLTELRGSLDAEDEEPTPLDAGEEDDQLLVEADIPDWLAELTDAQRPSESMAELPDADQEVTGPGEQADFPDWLTEPVKGGRPIDADVESGDELDDWLDGQAKDEDEAWETPDEPSLGLTGYFDRALGDETVEAQDSAAAPAGDQPEDEEDLFALWTAATAADKPDEGRGEEALEDDWGADDSDDWLAALPDSAAGKQAGEPAAEVVDEVARETVDDSDDWLAALREGEAEPVDEPVDDSADWLAALPDSEDGPVDETADVAADMVEDDFDDWLADLPDGDVLPDEEPPLAEALDDAGAGAPEESDVTLSAGEPAPDDIWDEAPAAIPDWLANLDDAAAALEAEGDEEPDTGLEPAWGGELPQWLGDIAPYGDAQKAGEAPADRAESGAPPDEAFADVPDYLAGSELPEWLQDSLDSATAEAGQPAADRGPDKADDLPEWLRPGQQGDTFDSALEAALTADERARRLPQMDQEWEDILGQRPSESDQPAPPDLPARPLSDAEIPAWLRQLRPQDKDAGAAPTPDEPEETAGPLSGMRGIVEIEPVIAQPRSAEPMRRAIVTKEHEQQVALLRQLRQESPRRRAAVAVPGDKGLSPLVRALLALLLVLAVVGGLLYGNLLDLASPSLHQGSQAFHDALAAAAGRPVLVAFDYSPARAGEMNVLAQLVLDELDANNSPVVALSQYATGAGLSKMLLDSRSGHSLGFVAGEAIGLRQLAGCLSPGNCATLQGRPLNDALDGVALVVVLTGDRDSLVDWLEQVGAATDLPLVAGVSQAIGPVALPYLASGQLSGLLDGLPDAAAYENSFRPDRRSAAALLNGQAAGQWATVLLIILGGLWYGFTGFLPARRSQRPAAPADTDE